MVHSDQNVKADAWCDQLMPFVPTKGNPAIEGW
eukprot:CAMPEP_0119091322 /NCGR_PEP_ID=MMETSP1178-20130426/155909_1 /TAXON_ID=33656 /ORGANISM="unid sp, Strain CCMP2000" /LENGTH=32 /DNA_ID= /DNA_START= /DNA_END= /DNA_ORIENTATION=